MPSASVITLTDEQRELQAVEETIPQIERNLRILPTHSPLHLVNARLRRLYAEERRRLRSCGIQLPRGEDT